MENASRQYLLKILSGPHQGAEVALDDGEITAGSSLECDLILSDSMIAPTHLVIAVGNDEIAITPKADKVYVNGKGIPKETRQIEPFEYITIGSTHMVIGPSEATWPAMHPPSLSTLKEYGEEEEALAPTPSAQNAAGSQPQATTVAPPSPPPPSDLFSLTKVIFTKKIYEPLFLIKTGILVALLVIAGVMALVMTEDKGPAAHLEPEEIEPAKQEVLRVLENMGISKEYVSISVNQFGQLKIEGQVETAKQARDAASALREINPYYRTFFKSQESLVTASTGILEMLKAPVNVSSTGIGSIKVIGYFPNEGAWEKAKTNLLTDVPGLKSIEDEVVTGVDVRERTNPILEENKLTQSVGIYTLINGVYARGRLSDNMRSNWEKARFDLQKSLGPNVPFFDQVVLIPAAQRLYLDSPIESITISDNLSWMTLKNGKTFFEGSSIPSGYTIDDITKKGVILKRGRESVTLKVGDQ